MRRRAFCLLSAAAIFALGAVVSADDKPREIHVSRETLKTLQGLARDAAEIETARRQVEVAMRRHADEVAAIHSEIRSRYGILEHEEFVSVDQEKGLLYVKASPAPVGTR